MATRRMSMSTSLPAERVPRAGSDRGATECEMYGCFQSFTFV